MELVENFMEISDTAKGFKARLLGEGWSEEVAMQASGEMLVGMIRHIFTVMQVETYSGT